MHNSNDAGAVGYDGLHLFETQQREEAAKLVALRRAATEGFAALDAGRYIEIEASDLAARIGTRDDTPPTE